MILCKVGGKGENREGRDPLIWSPSAICAAPQSAPVTLMLEGTAPASVSLAKKTHSEPQRLGCVQPMLQPQKINQALPAYFKYNI